MLLYFFVVNGKSLKMNFVARNHVLKFISTYIYRVKPSYMNLLKTSYWLSAGNPLNCMWSPFSLQRICWTPVPRRRGGDTRKNGLCSAQILILWMLNVQVCVFVYSPTCSAHFKIFAGDKLVKYCTYLLCLTSEITFLGGNACGRHMVSVNCWKYLSQKRKWNGELKIH